LAAEGDASENSAAKASRITLNLSVTQKCANNSRRSWLSCEFFESLDFLQRDSFHTDDKD